MKILLEGRSSNLVILLPRRFRQARVERCALEAHGAVAFTESIDEFRHMFRRLAHAERSELIVRGWPSLHRIEGQGAPEGRWSIAMGDPSREVGAFRLD